LLTLLAAADYISGNTCIGRANLSIQPVQSLTMADTAPKIAAKEHREALSTVDKKAEALASQIKQAKHLIAFTGAGISTSAGIVPSRYLFARVESSAHAASQEFPTFAGRMAIGR
jgi:hypothetical protein